MITKRQEELIERIVELEMDRLDKKLIDGEISQEQYYTEAAELFKWADETYTDFSRKKVIDSSD